ncbi:MAG: hypothetical protein RSA70_03345 [Clostridia bacterium]
MKKYFNGALYNTDSAEILAATNNGLPTSDFAYFSEALYRTKSCNYFIHGEGGARSRYCSYLGNTWSFGEKITPISEASAREWIAENFDSAKYEEVFAPAAEPVQMTIIISQDARNQLEELKATSGKTFRAIIEEAVALLANEQREK